MSLFVVDRPPRGQSAWSAQRSTQQCLALIIALATVLSATGACDTDNLGLVHRTSLWLVIAALVVLQATGFYRGLRARVDSLALRMVLASGATVILTTCELHFLKFTPFLPKAPDPPLAFLLFVLPMAGPVALLTLWLVYGQSTQTTGQSRAPTLATANFGGAPDVWPRGAVLRVTAQDHYLRVVTAQSSTLIRGRMTDALQRLAAEHGIQIHRSHWVAIDQIVRIVRNGRDYRAVLRDGSALPVGRSRVAALRSGLDTP